MIRPPSLAARQPAPLQQGAASTRTPPAPALRPHLALRYAVLDRTLGRAAADAWLRSLPSLSRT